jgi:hypothetical protein
MYFRLCRRTKEKVRGRNGDISVTQFIRKFRSYNMHKKFVVQWLRHWTGKLYVQSSGPTRVKFNYFFQQELRGLVDEALDW